jgi:hypothetical protein
MTRILCFKWLPFVYTARPIGATTYLVRGLQYLNAFPDEVVTVGTKGRSNSWSYLNLLASTP